MIQITKIVEENIAAKIDTKFVEQALNGVDEDAGIVFVCTNDDWRKDDAWKKKGVRYLRIVLPYEKVVDMEADDVRKWMLELAKERLGLAGKMLTPVSV